LSHSNFSFNRNDLYNKSRLNNSGLNLLNKQNPILENIHKQKSLNESIFNLSYYNGIQDGFTGFTLLIKEFVRLDRKLEFYKEKIASAEDLELNDIFKFFDTNYKGYYLFEDFKNGVNNMEINADFYVLKSLFRFLDRDNDNSISYNEFCDFICPRNLDLSARLRNKVLNNEKEISENSKNLIVDFFRLLIDHEERLESIKTLFIKKPLFNISEIYQILRGKIKCFVVKKDVIKFFKNSQ